MGEKSKKNRPRPKPKVVAPLSWFKARAIERGGRCLSERYATPLQLLAFECSEKHAWLGSGIGVYATDAWCPHCAMRSSSVNQEAPRLSKKS